MLRDAREFYKVVRRQSGIPNLTQEGVREDCKTGMMLAVTLKDDQKPQSLQDILDLRRHVQRHRSVKVSDRPPPNLAMVEHEKNWRKGKDGTRRHALARCRTASLQGDKASPMGPARAQGRIDLVESMLNCIVLDSFPKENSWN